MLASFVFIGIVLYLFFYETIGKANTPIVAYVYLSIAFVTATINIVYHIVTFYFCKQKKKINLERKVSKLLWIGGICFSSFMLYIGGAGLYNFFRFIKYGFEMKQLVFIVSFLLIALLGFLELSLLRKRIKRLRKEQETKDDIETIGGF